VCQIPGNLGSGKNPPIEWKADCTRDNDKKGQFGGGSYTLGGEGRTNGDCLISSFG